MAGTRALFASIGASVALVAAAALSLLAVSAVFAFGGWAESPSSSVRQPAFVFAAVASQPVGAGVPIKTAPGKRDVSGRTGRTSSESATAPARPTRRDTVRPAGPETGTVKGDSLPTLPATHPVPETTHAPVTKPDTAGEGVRKVGEDVSSTVQGTGSALAQITAPLLPPISAAVQQVFNAVAAVLSQTTAGLGGAIDAVIPPK